MGCCGKNEQEPIEMQKPGENDGPAGPYGKSRKYDPSFNGPIKNRSCTDVICCILFTVYIVGMLIVGVLAFTWGDPMKLLYPTDTHGAICGEGDHIDRKNIFFFDLLECLPKDISDIYSITSCKTHQENICDGCIFSKAAGCCFTKNTLHCGCKSDHLRKRLISKDVDVKIQICVKDCPSTNAYYKTASNKELYCKYETQARLDNNEVLTDAEKEANCAKYTLQSTNFAYRCIPTVVGDSIEKFLDSQSVEIATDGKNLTTNNIKLGTIAQSVLINLQNVGRKVNMTVHMKKGALQDVDVKFQVIADVQESWYWILAGFGICMVASFLYIVIMRWVAGLMVWLTTYAVLTLIGYATYYCYTEYDRLASMDNSSIAFDFITNLDSYADKKETWMVLGIFCAIVLLVLLLLLLALRKRIQIAIQLIKEGSKALTAMLSTLFFPLFPWLLQLILFAWFVGVLAYLATSGDASYKVNNGTSSQLTDTVCDALDAAKDWMDVNKTISCNFEKYKTDDNILRLQVFHLFGWFWIMNFIIAFGQCTLAGAFASWYWAWDKKTERVLSKDVNVKIQDVPTLPLLSAMGRTLRYHTGSLAFGSLIIAIVQIIRAALEYIEWKLRGSGHEPSPIAKFILKCLKCCFWCLEKFLKFLNKNAYIEIAVYGKNFCVSAKNAFFLLMRNILRVAVLDKVTDFLLFIGKLTITGGMGVASFYFFSKQDDLNYYLTPVIIITIAAWVVASAFFGVYEMAINTIFLCFLEDSERHDGTPEKPYYMSKKLRKILGKKNKKVEDEDE